MNRGLHSLAPWAPTVLALIAAIYAYGVQSARIDNIESDVTKLERGADTNAETLKKIEKSTTVIETKLEILLPTARDAQQ